MPFAFRCAIFRKHPKLLPFAVDEGIGEDITLQAFSKAQGSKVLFYSY